MKLPTAAILISVLISCHTVDTETENAIKGTFETLTDDLLSGKRDGVNRHCTLNGLASISGHFDMESESGLKELGVLFRDQKISGFQRTQHPKRVRMFIGRYQQTTGKSAIDFIRVGDTWKVEAYLAGK
ncbi:MAG TPA: hypothetical protein VFT90_12210 [Chryseosolibacter sp.]|nr:hypothetical protein [Chryseosolibacter sp.]